MRTLSIELNDLETVIVCVMVVIGVAMMGFMAGLILGALEIVEFKVRDWRREK